MKKYLHLKSIFILFLSNLVGCNTPKLESHYHLEWGNKFNKFQIWNIDGNRMKINEPVCLKSDTNCFSSRIYFSKGLINVSPWVDFHYTADYKIDKNGIINMINEHNGVYDTLKLVPHKDCITSDQYFKQKLKRTTTDFKLIENDMMNFAISPSKIKNELIIGKSNSKTFILFNGNKITEQTILKKVNKEELSVYVDERIKLKEILPSLHLFRSKGYSIQLMTKEVGENNEQVAFLKKSIVSINTLKNDFYKIASCEFCYKYPDKKIDTVFKFKIFGKDSCLVNDKITDFFQLRNQICRSLIKNRTTRLHSEIQLEINSEILFKYYLELSSQLDFVNTELQGTYYRNKKDPDQKRILDLQNNKQFRKISLEFPLRISETIHSF